MEAAVVFDGRLVLQTISSQQKDIKIRQVIGRDIALHAHKRNKSYKELLNQTLHRRNQQVVTGRLWKMFPKWPLSGNTEP
jgi:hypothetical protein